MLRNKLALGLVALSIVGGVAACSHARSSEAPPTSAEESVIRERVTIGEARRKTGLGVSYEAMLINAPDVVVGEVISVKDVSDLPASGFRVDGGESEAQATVPPGHPKAGAPTPSPYDPKSDPPQVSLYTIRVLESIVGGLKAGEEINVMQNGGLRNGVAYELEGDPVIEVGKSYLMFAALQEGYGWYATMPWGRYEISNNKLVPVSAEFDAVNIQKALKGLDAADAKAKIKAEKSKLVP